MPPITTAAMAIGASTQIMLPCAIIPLSGLSAKKTATLTTT